MKTKARRAKRKIAAKTTSVGPDRGASAVDSVSVGSVVGPAVDPAVGAAVGAGLGAAALLSMLAEATTGSRRSDARGVRLNRRPGSRVEMAAG
jgi:hypothetical protein